MAYTVVVHCTEDTEETETGRESYTPPRLVVGSLFRAHLEDDEGFEVFDYSVSVVDPLVGPEEMTARILEDAGYELAGEFGPEWITNAFGIVTTAPVRAKS